MTMTTTTTTLTTTMTMATMATMATTTLTAPPSGDEVRASAEQLRHIHPISRPNL